MKHLILVAIGILVLFNAGFLSPDDTNNNLNEIESFVIPSHGLYPDYTYRELTEISDLIVIGHFSSFEEARWSTPDGKQPDGVKIIKGIDGDGFEYVDFILDVEDETIYTDSTFQVKGYLKGKTDSEKITIRFFSGTVEMLQAKEHKGLNPEDYKKSKQVVLYLTQSTNTTEDGSHYYVIVTPKGSLFVEGNVLINSEGDKFDFEEIKSFIK